LSLTTWPNAPPLLGRTTMRIRPFTPRNGRESGGVVDNEEGMNDKDASRPEPESEPEQRRGLAGTVVRGASYSALGYAVAQAITLATYIVLARIITPHDFGVYTAATVLIGFTLLVTESGMVSAVVQRRDHFEEAANTALLATLASGLTF